jgi:two-component system response regulator PhoP
LATFYRSLGWEIVSKTELRERLYDNDSERDYNVVDVIVARLRRKLDPEDAIEPIQTVRGRGYRFRLGRDDRTG